MGRRAGLQILKSRMEEKGRDWSSILEIEFRVLRCTPPPCPTLTFGWVIHANNPLGRYNNNQLTCAFEKSRTIQK